MDVSVNKQLKFSTLLRPSISALPEKGLKYFFFFIKDVSADNITLCRGQHVALKLRVARAWASRCFLHNFHNLNLVSRILVDIKSGQLKFFLTRLPTAPLCSLHFLIFTSVARVLYLSVFLSLRSRFVRCVDGGEMCKVGGMHTAGLNSNLPCAIYLWPKNIVRCYCSHLSSLERDAGVKHVR
jgi:hypothetical protein